MKILKKEVELSMKDFEMMIRAYLNVDDKSSVKIRIDGADILETFEDILVIIEDK